MVNATDFPGHQKNAGCCRKVPTSTGIFKYRGQLLQIVCVQISKNNTLATQYCEDNTGGYGGVGKQSFVFVWVASRFFGLCPAQVN